MSDNRVLCTPRKPFTRPESEDRERFYISRADAAKVIPGKKWNAKVTCLDTGATYDLQGAPCTLGCHCDAVILRKEMKDE
jgi:hypothetical protein